MIPPAGMGLRGRRWADEDGGMRIRPVRTEDVPAVQEIERAAGKWFHDVGMPEIAEDEPFGAEELARYQQSGTAWVAVTEDDLPVAYLVAEPVDGNLHVEQVSVHPDSARRRVGRSLLDHLAELAAATGVPALTLTTFADVPWNAPYYARCGFRILDESTLGPGMRAVREREAAHGLDRWRRVSMRRNV